MVEMRVRRAVEYVYADVELDEVGDKNWNERCTV
jgi:hypothetical protein